MAKQNPIITCKYLPFRLGEGYKFFPLLSVNIRVKEITQTIALVDSGSTHTFLPYGLAETIGLLDNKKKLGKGKTIAASGKFNTYVGRLKQLQLLKGNHVFAKFNETIVHIPTEDEEDLPHMILGRDSIFKRYAVTFHENKRKMTFQKC